MRLDHESCYQIIRARDRRFDGRFFTGVITTGIYCRPICPARTPQSRNVRFYAHAAAAEADGLRPCRRCRPDAAPGTPAWEGTASSVRRALRLISEGLLDETSVEVLAGRVGMGERQLRRLFQETVGVSPLAVAKTRRAHFARQLIDETSLPISRIAATSGFASIRQFNDQMLSTFKKSPTELRRAVKTPVVPPPSIELRVPYRAPLDWQGLVDYLEPRAIPFVEAASGNTYRRTCLVEGEAALIEVMPAVGVEPDSCLLLRYRGPIGPSLIRIMERVRQLLDLDAEPHEVNHVLAKEKALRRLVDRRPGLRVPGAWDRFEILVRSILGQQVSVKGATTLAGRLVQRFGTPVPRDLEDGRGDLTHLFPSPQKLAGADIAPIGIPGKRAESIRAVAQAICTGSLSLDDAPGLAATTESLTRLKGIGPWTAHYVAMRAFREPDAFPAGDLGLRKAWARLQNQTTVSERELGRRAEAWRPFCGYAALHLWSTL